MDSTLRCWIYHIVGSKPGDLKSHLLGSSLTKNDLLYLRDVKLNDLGTSTPIHLQVLGKVKEKRGKDGQSCFEEVVTAVANQTLNKHTSMKCLRTDDLAALLSKYGFREDVLQVRYCSMQPMCSQRIHAGASSSNLSLSRTLKRKTLRATLW